MLNKILLVLASVFLLGSVSSFASDAPSDQAPAAAEEVSSDEEAHAKDKKEEVK